MTLLSDALFLFDGRRIRALTVIENGTRESLAIEVDREIKGEQVVAVMNRIAAMRGKHKTIEFTMGRHWTDGPTCIRERSTSRAGKTN